jgi:RNA polymerase sigma-70 factor, ECF subfamily
MNVGYLNAETDPVISPRNDDELSDILGGPRATETFVRRETGWMVAICRRILRDDALAKDCVQNAFVNVFKFLGAFKGDSKLKTWMYRIVVNQALMDLRKRRRLQEEPINGLLPEF